jgi:hypothetical protein
LFAHLLYLLKHRGFRFLIESILTALGALNMTLHVLNVQLRLYIGFVDELLLLLNL